MTAHMRAELRCDFPGCTATFDVGNPRIMPTRVEAEAAKWVYVLVPRRSGPVVGRDLCPEHAISDMTNTRLPPCGVNFAGDVFPIHCGRARGHDGMHASHGD